jgi:hypothetical protein
VQQGLMELKVLPALPVLSDLKDRLALQVWQERMERQVLSVQLAQLVLKDWQGQKETRD